MGLEAGNFIADLVITNPPGTDQKLQGDDHIRLIKKCLTQTFPGFNAALLPTFADIQKLRPAGTPEFAGIEVGNAADTTITRFAAGRIAVEGNELARLAAANSWTAIQTIASTNPRLKLNDTNAAANEKFTEFSGNSGLTIAFQDDAEASPINVLAIARVATVPAAWDLRGTDFRFNRQENAQTAIRIGEPTTLRGNSADSAIIFFGENAGAIGSVTVSYTGSQLQFSTSNASSVSYNMSCFVAAGNIFRIFDPGNTDHMTFSHDGTNFLIAGVNTANIIVSGITAMEVPALEIGHASDTTVTRAAAGTIAVEGQNVLTVATGLKQGRRTLPIMAGAMIPAATNGAAPGTVATGTNAINYKTLDFDQTTQEFAHFQVPFPKSWNKGTVTFQPIWTAAAGAGGVVFELEAVAVSNDDVIDAAFGTAQNSIDTLLALGDLHVGPESAAITIAGTPANDDLVFFRIKRAPANASDTLTGDARLIGIRVFYTDNAADDT